MDCFEILGIPETKDVKEIRKAYSKLLVKYSPEKDQEGFKRLRGAYDQALVRAKEQEEPLGELSPEDKFMNDFKNTYMCFEKRISTDAWTELLDRDICCNIDTSKKISNKILTFLMDNFNLPYEVWRLFDSYFSWSTNKKRLYEAFPKGFIDFVVYKINNKSNFRYENLKQCSGNKQDTFISEFNKVFNALEEYDLYTADKAISAAWELCPEHPDLMILIGRYLMLNGKVKEAEDILNDVIENCGNDIEALFNRGEVYFRIGRLEEAYDDYKKALNLKPDFAAALYSMGKCCISLKKYEEAIKYVEKLIEKFQYRQDFRVILTSAYNFLMDDLLKAAADNPRDTNIKYKLAEGYFKTSRVDDSRKVLEELIHNPEASADIYLLYCQVLMSQKNKESAYAFVCSALNLFRDNYELNFLKADILDELGRYEEADAQYDRVLAMNDKDCNAYNNKSYILNKLKKYNEALEYADKALELDSSIAHAYKNRAEALLGLNYYEECLRACEQALNIYQFLTEVYIIKMKALTGMKLYSEALETCSKAEELHIDDSRLNYEKARALMFLQRYDEAIHFYDLSVQSGEKNADYYYNTGLCYYFGQYYKDASERFDKVIQCDSLRGDAYFYKAKSLIALSRAREAILIINEAIKLNMKDLDNFYALKGSIMWSMHDYNETIEQYKKAISIYPDYAHYYYSIGRALNELKRYTEAVDYFLKSVKLDPDSADCYVDMSFAYYNMKKFYDCIDNCNRAIKINNKDVTAHQNKAWALFNVGDINESEQECNIALKLDENNRQLLLLKLKILKQKGSYNEALAICNRMLLIDCNDMKAKNLQKELIDKINGEKAKNERKGFLKSLFK